jgi:hypothetical protein
MYTVAWYEESRRSYHLTSNSVQEQYPAYFWTGFSNAMMMMTPIMKMAKETRKKHAK